MQACPLAPQTELTPNTNDWHGAVRQCLGLLLITGIALCAGTSRADDAFPAWKQINASKQKQDKMNKLAYHDVYLLDNQVCRKCSGAWINAGQVELTNRQGDRTIVYARDILGVDTHPVFRKILIHSIQNVGLAGPEIAPYAFANWDKYACKYCDH